MKGSKNSSNLWNFLESCGNWRTLVCFHTVTSHGIRSEEEQVQNCEARLRLKMWVMLRDQSQCSPFVLVLKKTTTTQLIANFRKHIHFGHVTIDVRKYSNTLDCKKNLKGSPIRNNIILRIKRLSWNQNLPSSPSFKLKGEGGWQHKDSSSKKTITEYTVHTTLFTWLQWTSLNFEW